MKTRRLKLIIAACAGLATAAWTGIAISACGTAAEAKGDISEPEDIDRFILEKMDKAKIQGLAAVIIKDDAVAWTGNYGYADAAAGLEVTAETIFPVASITKTVTGAAILQLSEEGRVDLDESINAYLPFKVAHPRFPASRITLRMLLQHRSGIVDYDPVVEGVYTIKSGLPDPDMSLDDFLRAYLPEGGKWYDARKNFTKKAPGTEFAYSNVGFALVGYVVERVSGKPFNEYCRERIFAPLGMDSTGFFTREIDAAKLTLNYFKGKPLKPYSYASYPDGGLRTTTLDYAKFLRAIMNGGEADGARILKESTMGAMLPDELSKRLIWNEDPMKDFHVDSGGRVIVGHTGGDPGIVTAAYFNRANNVAVVIFVNTIPPSPLMYVQFKYIVERLNEFAGF